MTRTASSILQPGYPRELPFSEHSDFPIFSLQTPATTFLRSNLPSDGSRPLFPPQSASLRESPSVLLPNITQAMTLNPQGRSRAHVHSGSGISRNHLRVRTRRLPSGKRSADCHYSAVAAVNLFQLYGLSSKTPLFRDKCQNFRGLFSKQVLFRDKCRYFYRLSLKTPFLRTEYRPPVISSTERLS